MLLLNTCLTVEAHKANSHQKRGWEDFTMAVINYVSSVTPIVCPIRWSFTLSLARCLPFEQGVHR